MSAPKVGQISEDQSLRGRRDAFHVPGILVTADDFMSPGENVRFLDTALTIVTSCELRNRQAVVDPFVPPANIGELFWVFLAPELVSNLQHTFDIKEITEESIAAAEADDESDECRGCYS